MRRRFLISAFIRVLHGLYAMAVFVLAPLCLSFCLLLSLSWSDKAHARKAESSIGVFTEVKVSALPSEAQATIVLIRKGGPFPYPKDGVVFGNREKILPKQARGFYSEYTVKTPGERSRGARRIIVGGEPRTSTEYYYSSDHYQTFQRIRE
jgi:ribonuclease T1